MQQPHYRLSGTDCSMNQTHINDSIFFKKEEDDGIVYVYMQIYEMRQYYLNYQQPLGSQGRGWIPLTFVLISDILFVLYSFG